MHRVASPKFFVVLAVALLVAVSSHSHALSRSNEWPLAAVVLLRWGEISLAIAAVAYLAVKIDRLWFFAFLVTTGIAFALLMAPRWGVMPGHWNWQGKALSFLFGVGCVAALGAWQEVGITSRLKPGWWKLFAVLAVVFAGLRFATSHNPSTAEALAFQATMPGLDEELWFRGLWLWFLMRAFGPGYGWLGVQWSWGALIITLLFGLVHIVAYDSTAGGLVLHMERSVTLIFGLAFWAVRERPGSVWPAVALHNISNAAGHLNAF